MLKSKNETLLKDFIKYCEANPEMRFWQALRNWAKLESLIAAVFKFNRKGEVQLLSWRDTFYWEEKNPKLPRAKRK